jgi:hypothetical protein
VREESISPASFSCLVSASISLALIDLNFSCSRFDFSLVEESRPRFLFQR